MNRLLLFSAMIYFISFILYNSEIILLVWSDNSLKSLIRLSANTVDVTVFVFFVLRYVLATYGSHQSLSFPCTNTGNRLAVSSVFFSPHSCCSVSVYLITSLVSTYKVESRLQRASIFNWRFKHGIHK